MIPQCINLRERFGRKYRIAYEASYQHEYGPGARVEDPWLMILPGARGHVFPWDATRLAASTNSAGATARRLKALSITEVWQDGDGVTVLFPAEHLDEVANLLRLRRRRRVTERERSRLAALGRQFRFRPRRHGLQSDSKARPDILPPQVDPQDLPRPGRLN